MPPTPHLVKWDKELREKGLRIIAVYAPGKGDSIESVRELVKSKGITYPVVFDAEGRNNLNYGIQGMPVAYLLDVQGRVAWEGLLLKNKTTVKDDFAGALKRELTKIERPAGR